MRCEPQQQQLDWIVYGLSLQRGRAFLEPLQSRYCCPSAGSCQRTAGCRCPTPCRVSECRCGQALQCRQHNHMSGLSKGHQDSYSRVDKKQKHPTAPTFTRLQLRLRKLRSIVQQSSLAERAEDMVWKANCLPAATQHDPQSNS